MFGDELGAYPSEALVQSRGRLQASPSTNRLGFRDKHSSFFVRGKPSQPSEMSRGEVGAYSSEALLQSWVGSRPHPQTLD
jgi:hypothetical protein